MNTEPDIFVENALILSHQAYPGDQYILRLHAPQCATTAQPGQFVHIRCHELHPLRRPISIMRVSRDEHWVDLLYKSLGQGTALLSQHKAGENLNIMGPIGTGFTLDNQRPLLIGGGVGIPPMIFLSEVLKNQKPAPMVILGSEVPFPFNPRPSQILIEGIPSDVTASMPLLDDWEIPCRLCSNQGFPGCYHGYVTELANDWLVNLDQSTREEVKLYACGPDAMLKAVVALARKYHLPVDIAVEEYMACGVGGCAGCTVEVTTETGPEMKRVCVDGPVFDGYSIYG